ncbi:MAG: phBC6A51 family helix-turn-helix protein, partial [Patescibacteria group bacterium]
MENTTIQDRQEKNKSDLVEQLKKTPIIELTCKKVGVGRATFYRWRRDDPEFAQQVEQSLDEGLATISDLAESKLISAIQNDNLSATIFWLKSRHQAYKTKVELSTAEKPKEELSPDQQKVVQEALLLNN